MFQSRSEGLARHLVEPRHRHHAQLPGACCVHVPVEAAQLLAERGVRGVASGESRVRGGGSKPAGNLDFLFLMRGSNQGRGG